MLIGAGPPPGPQAAPLGCAASYSFSRAVAPRGRIAENAPIFDFTLSNADMAELDAFDRTGGTQRALERKWR
jgi:hypothetical protein